MRRPARCGADDGSVRRCAPCRVLPTPTAPCRRCSNACAMNMARRKSPWRGTLGSPSQRSRRSSTDRPRRTGIASAGSSTRWTCRSWSWRRRSKPSARCRPHARCMGRVHLLGDGAGHRRLMRTPCGPFARFRAVCRPDPAASGTDRPQRRQGRRVHVRPRVYMLPSMSGLVGDGPLASFHIRCSASWGLHQHLFSLRRAPLAHDFVTRCLAARLRAESRVATETIRFDLLAAPRARVLWNRYAIVVSDQRHRRFGLGCGLALERGAPGGNHPTKHGRPAQPLGSGVRDR